jgi:hypothetical protein
VILSFLLLAALSTRPRAPRSFSDSRTPHAHSVYLRLTQLLRFHA